MSLTAKKLANAAASLLTLILISKASNAQIDVLTGISSPTSTSYATTTTYLFNSSMILNSIGFYTNGGTPQSLSYSVNGVSESVSLSSLSSELDGFRWLTLSNPTTILQNQYVTVTTLGGQVKQGSKTITQTKIFQSFTVNASSNVSFVNTTFSTQTSVSLANSNLRVSASNPGSNVAPEPGSFALALTGGAVLLGICVRRRRLAG